MCVIWKELESGALWRCCWSWSSLFTTYFVPKDNTLTHSCRGKRRRDGIWAFFILLFFSQSFFFYHFIFVILSSPTLFSAGILCQLSCSFILFAVSFITFILLTINSLPSADIYFPFPVSLFILMAFFELHSDTFIYTVMTPVIIIFLSLYADVYLLSLLSCDHLHLCGNQMLLRWGVYVHIWAPLCKHTETGESLFLFWS